MFRKYMKLIAVAIISSLLLMQVTQVLNTVHINNTLANIVITSILVIELLSSLVKDLKIILHILSKELVIKLAILFEKKEVSFDLGTESVFITPTDTKKLCVCRC